MEPAVPTLLDLLRRAALHPDTGLRVLDRRGGAEWLPWPLVYERARRVAGGLREAGIVPGDRIALIFPTKPSFFDAFFGVLVAGAVPVPMYPPVRLGRLREYHERTSRMIAAVGARLVLADTRVQPLLGESILVGRPPLGCVAPDRLPAAMTDAGPPRSATDLALIQFSSGTTSEPKPVALSHRAVVAQARLLNAFWPDSEECVHSGVSWLPLYHDMGLIGCVFPALERPGTLTLIPPEAFIGSPAIWLQTVSRYRATVSPAPNFAFSLCTRRIRDEEMNGVDLSSWRVALNGAETVVPDVVRAFQRRFARWGFREEAMTPVYGLSEASLAVTFGDIGRPFVSRRFDREALSRGVALESPDGREIVSVGRPLPGVALGIVGPDGEGRPEGRVGLVVCRGPSTMEGYFGQPLATAAVLHDGWLDTGDCGFAWDGDLFLTGRAKDVLLLRGRNHAPEEVERAVDDVPGVRTGCAVATTWLPEGAEGERLLVFVEAVQGTDPARFPAIGRACADAIVERTSLVPDEVVMLAPGTLPRTSSGKLRRQDTLRLHLAGTLTQPPPITRIRIAAALLRSAVAFFRARRRG